MMGSGSWSHVTRFQWRPSDGRVAAKNTEEIIYARVHRLVVLLLPRGGKLHLFLLQRRGEWTLVRECASIPWNKGVKWKYYVRGRCLRVSVFCLFIMNAMWEAIWLCECLMRVNLYLRLRVDLMCSIYE